MAIPTDYSNLDALTLEEILELQRALEAHGHVWHRPPEPGSTGSIRWQAERPATDPSMDYEREVQARREFQSWRAAVPHFFSLRAQDATANMGRPRGRALLQAWNEYAKELQAAGMGAEEIERMRVAPFDR